MKLKLALNKSQIVGTPTQSSWSQSFVFEPDSYELKEKVGTLLGVVVVSSLGEKEAGAVGKDVLARISEKYFLESSGPQTEKLKKIIAEELNQKDGCEIAITLAIIKDDVLYVATTKEGEIVLKRDDNFIAFFQNVKEETALRSASGFINKDDILILKTKGFSQIIDNEKLIEIIKTSSSIEEASGTIAPEIHNANDSSSVAAVLVNFKEETTPEELEEVTFREPDRKILPSLPKLRLRRDTFSTPKIYRFVAIIIFLVLGGIVFLKITSDRAVNQKKEIANAIAAIKRDIEKGDLTVISDPNKAKTILDEAIKTVNSTKKLVQKNSPEEKELSLLIDKINNVQDKAVKKYQISPTLFFDLTIVKDKSLGDLMVKYEDNLAILDKKNSSAFILNIKNKSGEVIAGGNDLKDAANISLYGNNVYVLKPSSGILKVDIKDKSKSTVIKKDKWGEIKDLVSFTGNLYLLDVKNNQIWKYISTDNGFSDVNAYLTEDTAPDFSESLNMAINGSVFVLRSDGEVIKFTQGRPDNFNVKGLDKPFSSDGMILTNADLENIYVLDKGNSRIVVLSKDGAFKAQYTSSLIKTSNSLAVDEKTKKSLLLVGSKIYSFDLK